MFTTPSTWEWNHRDALSIGAKSRWTSLLSNDSFCLNRKERWKAWTAVLPIVQWPPRGLLTIATPLMGRNNSSLSKVRRMHSMSNQKPRLLHTHEKLGDSNAHQANRTHRIDIESVVTDQFEFLDLQSIPKVRHKKKVHPERQTFERGRFDAGFQRLCASNFRIGTSLVLAAKP